MEALSRQGIGKTLLCLVPFRLVIATEAKVVYENMRGGGGEFLTQCLRFPAILLWRLY
jgi:hypothetical protein